MKMFLMMLFLLSFSVQSFSQDILVKVSGMVCSMCTQGIKKKSSDVKEIEKLDVNLDKKEVSISLKKGQQIADERIKELIIEAGYNVTSIERQ